MHSLPHMTAAKLRLCGRVQGVGFRPFVLRLARQLDLAGSVQNLRGEVEIIAEGPHPAIESLTADLIARAPPLAAPRIVSRETIAPAGRSGFAILESSAVAVANISVPPDAFTCTDCLDELATPRDRRHGYPFINCTQCGPRYTLIEALPYDRANTTMAKFALCDSCREEYATPGDRRFHAEPIACPACGPQLSLEQPQRETINETAEALLRAVRLLRAGAVLAVKGIGGYHLMCGARDAAAVAVLRERKHRPAKPLAVMFPQTGVDGLDAVRAHVRLDAHAEQALLCAARPIVLAKRVHDAAAAAGSEKSAPSPEPSLAANIAPGLDEIGVLLPYSPLHHLLLDAVGAPLVATSGNVSGEPVLCDNVEARDRLATVADAFLHHDRRIARPADDSVLRVMRGRARVLRLGRGLAPCELAFPWRLPEPLLAVGGHLKTSVALAWDERAVISPHIGDMGTVRSERVFGQIVSDLQRLYGLQARAVVCDAHPAYATTRWARECGLPVIPVLHHHAHAAALAGEHNVDEPALIFTWDGTGMGSDGTLWGGETFFGTPGAWRRVASLRPFRLPGGDRSGRSPWRSAAALCWEAGIPWSVNNTHALAEEAWRRHVNSPASSAVGRLFDAAAALVLGVHETTFEGEGPMLLEARAHTDARGSAALPLYEDTAQLLRIDWAPLLDALLDERASVESRATLVHATLARTIAAVAQRVRSTHVFNAVGLTGGVFQNRNLTQLAAAELEHAGFSVWLSEQVPCNDGGLSFGQLVDAGAAARKRAPPS